MESEPELGARVQGLELRFDLFVITVRELLAIMKDEPALVARRPHLAREMAVLEVRLTNLGTVPIAHTERPWWHKLVGR